MMNFKDLGISETLCEAIDFIKWKNPTEIQKKAIPPALSGKDIVGLAKTGSGKTGAFTIPIIEGLMKLKCSYYALIFTPTRDLAQQIQTQLKGLGKGIGVKCCTLIGGLKYEDQVEQLKIKPHVIIATPGRFLKHIKSTRGFNENTLSNLKVLVLDECDKMLGDQFGQEINTILRILRNNKTQNFLFSATYTTDSMLSRMMLNDPVRVQVDEQLANIETLSEYALCAPVTWEFLYLLWLLNNLTGKKVTEAKIPVFEKLELIKCPPSLKENKKSILLFVNTIRLSMKFTIFFNNMGFNANSMNGDMTQEKRAGAINKMKAKEIDILIATDVMARGIDISNIDVVIQFMLPNCVKDYTHRIGRTARAGKSGISVLIFNNDNMLQYATLEKELGRSLNCMLLNEEQKRIVDEETNELEIFLETYKESKKTLDKIQQTKNKRKAMNITDHIMKKKRRH